MKNRSIEERKQGPNVQTIQQTNKLALMAGHGPIAYRNRGYVATFSFVPTLNSSSLMFSAAIPNQLPPILLEAKVYTKLGIQPL